MTDKSVPVSRCLILDFDGISNSYFITGKSKYIFNKKQIILMKYENIFLSVSFKCNKYININVKLSFKCNAIELFETDEKFK